MVFGLAPVVQLATNREAKCREFMRNTIEATQNSTASSLFPGTNRCTHTHTHATTRSHATQAR